MSLSVRFRPLAKSDVEDAVGWYGDERPALALAFTRSLDSILGRISESPQQFPFVHGKVRRALLGRFPYGVFFVAGPEFVDVLAVVHLHREPSTWQQRT